ncbi:Protein trichome birefringence-like 32 [Bienertia sinuspersici]
MIDLAPFKELNSTNIEINKSSNLILDETKKLATKKKCNIFDGKWVYKPEESNSYNSFNCPFISEKTSCQINGRPDSMYENWRWEARDCDIPLFNGTDMLEKLRNKRMILVGDSLNHNMWQSLVCLLLTSIPPSTTKLVTLKVTLSFSFIISSLQEYNFTLQFYWSAYLTEVYNNESGEKVLVVDKLPEKSSKWIGADILVFNSGHWWGLRGKSKALRLFEVDGKLIQDMPIELAYKLSLKTWTKWIKTNIDPTKTSVFFRSYSPVHKFSKYDQSCYNKTQPMIDDSYIPDFPKSMFDVVEKVLKGVRNHVKYLNITKLSAYRIDAHPSLYTNKYDHDPKSYADCSHWCIPGVPDTWNRLLYASIFFDMLVDDTPIS